MGMVDILHGEYSINCPWSKNVVGIAQHCGFCFNEGSLVPLNSTPKASIGHGGPSESGRRDTRKYPAVFNIGLQEKTLCKGGSRDVSNAL